MNTLRGLRLAASLAQQQLAGAAGVHIRQSQKLESGENKPANVTFKNGLTLATALGVDPEVLLDE